MEIEKALNELSEAKSLSIQEILNNLLDGEQNLDLKTHIFKPKDLSALYVLGNYLKTNKATHSSQIIGEFIEIYLRYMVSYKRLSRTEIIKAISSMLEDKSQKGNITIKE